MLRVFGSPSRYVQGPGALGELAGLVGEREGAILLVADAIVLGLLRPALLDALGAHAARAAFAEFGGECTADEIARLAGIARERRASAVVGVGGGTRVRHTVSIALDLGLPTGGVAQLVGAMEEANAVFLNALLAKNGSIVMQREHFWELPLYLESHMLPIVISIPPYHFWEPPPEEGPLPTHGSDFGLLIHAEVLGTRHIIFVKDEDGLYDKDPKKHSNAKLISNITLSELMKNMPEELIIDRQLFVAWQRARHVHKVQIVNGLKPGQLTRALAGESVGTVITKDG